MELLRVARDQHAQRGGMEERRKREGEEGGEQTGESHKTGVRRVAYSVAPSK
jgi:hypothetical protein